MYFVLHIQFTKTTLQNVSVDTRQEDRFETDLPKFCCEDFIDIRIEGEYKHKMPSNAPAPMVTPIFSHCNYRQCCCYESRKLSVANMQRIMTLYMQIHREQRQEMSSARLEMFGLGQQRVNVLFFRTIQQFFFYCLCQHTHYLFE